MERSASAFTSPLAKKKMNKEELEYHNFKLLAKKQNERHDKSIRYNCSSYDSRLRYSAAANFLNDDRNCKRPGDGSLALQQKRRLLKSQGTRNRLIA